MTDKDFKKLGRRDLLDIIYKLLTKIENIVANKHTHEGKGL